MAARQAFNEPGVKKLSKIKELNAEYADLLSGKKAAYTEYRKLRDEAREFSIAKANIESLYEAESGDSEQRQRERSR